MSLRLQAPSQGRCPAGRARLAPRARSIIILNAASDRRAVLITGTSTGIGKTTALYLARKGWQVFAGVRRSADGEALVAEAEAMDADEEGDVPYEPGCVVPLQLDVTNSASTAGAVGMLKAKLGDRNLSGLVNNAGKGVFLPLEIMPPDVFDDVMAVNVTGVVRVTQAALPLLRKSRPDQQPGRIVNIGSYAGSIALPLFGAYAASKFALEALSDTMRYELGPRWGIRTSLIKASGVRTPIWDKSLGASRQFMAVLEEPALQPYNSMCEEIMDLAQQADENGISPEEVAETVAHALSSPSPQTRYLIGNGAWLQMTARRLLPDWVWDKLLLTKLRRTNKPADE
ncbi:hypothetical protein HYH03_006949 [Edaphochlamys debaryana]|uniref:Uncharacterized protein n=1 Tax=Edaphochlamys debaryana TaxID=47281 RepID=A0A835Y308_9CHLO|nr:hypothetical protein HYH03_006949 [Edaphochlamys debaryana]|eukprot:KAG2495016.1 hypothetical protein HYH03_006949 [Edaphochlamys debaryana]